MQIGELGGSRTANLTLCGLPACTTEHHFIVPFFSPLNAATKKFPGFWQKAIFSLTVKLPDPGDTNACYEPPFIKNL